MVEDIEETMMTKVNASPAFSIMTDEATNVGNRKHLAYVVKYVDQEDGSINIDFVKDVEIDNGRAETIFNETMKVIETNLTLDRFAAFGSDGCSVMIGKKSGVSTRLKEVKPDLLTIHCQNHRLALAAKDSFENIPVFREADETLNNLFKYYKGSAVRTKSSEKMQKLLEDSEVRKIKKVAHTRWLSHLDAVTSLRDCYSAILMDLENAIETGNDKMRIGSGLSANGLVKKLKSYKMIHLTHFLCDALKHVTSLALTFERNDIDLSVVQPRLQSTLNALQKLKDSPGLSTKKVEKILQDQNITPDQKSVASLKTLEAEFLDNLIANITRRIENTDIINSMGALKIDEDFNSFTGNDEVETLSEHYSMDTDTVLEEWDNFKNMVSELDVSKLNGPSALLRVIHRLKKTTGDFCPHIEKLCSVAAVLPVSTAEVERVFSDVNRTVTESRNRLQVESTHKLLMLHRNSKYLNLSGAVRRWANKKTKKNYE